MLIGTILQFVALLYVDTIADGAPTDPVQLCLGKTPQFFDGTKCRDCITCKPGYGLSEVCGNGHGVSAFCQPCPTRHFSESDSVEMCQPCTPCPTKMGEDVPCLPTSNRICVSCKCGLVKDQCGSCADDNNFDTIDEPTLNREPGHPAYIAIYVAIPLALVLMLLGVLCFKKDMWGLLKRTCSLNRPNETNPGTTDNTEGQNFLEDRYDPALRTSAEPNIIHQEEEVLVHAVPDLPECSSDLERQSEFDDSNPVSPTSSSGTQTTSFLYNDVSCSDNRTWEFGEKLQKAIKQTKDTPLGEMEQADVDLLERYLQAKGVVAKYHSTSEPNYLSIAKMYEIDKYIQRGFESVTDVINHIANTDRTHPTVADFLKKVYESQECFQLLGKLVEQILDRTKACQNDETWV